MRTTMDRILRVRRPRLAERVGFEPTNTFWVLLEFQSSAFDRSATSPINNL